MHRSSGLLKAIKIFGSQRALAEALGIKQQAISNWMNREFKIPYLQVIKIVCLTKGQVKPEELAPDEYKLNQSFYEMFQECGNFKLEPQSNINTSLNQNHTPCKSTTSTENEYDHLAYLLPLCKHAFLKLFTNEEENTMRAELYKILPQFWFGEIEREIMNLDVESRLLAFYLMRCPHSNMIGIYYLPIAYVAYDTNISPDKIKKALSELIQVGFCSYDFKAQYVWVHDIAKHQVFDYLEDEDQKVSIINDIFRSLPNLIFLKDFYEKYQGVFHLLPREEFLELEDLPETTAAKDVINKKQVKRNKQDGRSQQIGLKK